MEHDLVRYSGAGTAFHYRWAARRCLKLLDPLSGVESIYVEGSKEAKLGGECSIDLAEYVACGDIRYYQLKHTTTQKESSFSFTHLKDTLKRFMERYAEDKTAPVEFYFITNRSVSNQLKNAICEIAKGNGRKLANFKKLQKLTNLDPDGIEKFCELLKICDIEGDFRQQKDDLRKESLAYFSSCAESIELDSLIALVTERALPSRAGKKPTGITKENVLSQFGVGSEKVLYPADPKFDSITHPQKRAFQDELLEQILRDDSPLVIRASGGVGKTVVAQQLTRDLPHPHRAVVYDCFGNGSYRNPSEPRHPSKVALVQIANELARDGLCSPLIPRHHDGDHTLFAAFKDRLVQAISILRQEHPEARLILIIDAADNSEMAANEREESGFAKLLFREDLPEGCKLVAFSRPGKDRAELLQPPPTCHYYDLPSFTPAESLAHLKSVFPSATSSEGEEFHKLSQGNPRVQAFALNEETRDLDRLLVWLGPGNLTVEDIIRGQLEKAVANLKKKCPEVIQSQITSVCRCLATLPPCIPKEVLASAAKLESSDIDSFVADLGRPLWISDNLVYFRDEPTESWFRDTFVAVIGQVSEMVDDLMPLCETSSYVARALPSLLHRAKKSDELLSLALSDRGLPCNVGAAEIKEITIQRTQFAFKAALRGNRLLDACKLAFKAAEEMAGTERVDELLKRNADFIGFCLSPSATQELALSRRISAAWTGSSNIYTSLLLSTHDDFRGQALSFLRSSRNWLQTFMENVRKRPKNADHHIDHGPSLGLDELAAMAGAILNLEGIERTVDFLVAWKPKQCIYEITARLTKSLIDTGRIDDVRALMQEASELPHIVVGCCEQLIEACIIPDAGALGFTLQFLSDSPDLIEMPGIENLEQQRRHLPLVAFCEAASAHNLESTQILEILRKICEQAKIRNVSYFRSESRISFFRAHSLQMTLTEQGDFKTTEIWKSICKEAEDYTNSRRDEMPKLFGEYLFPWFLRRAQTLVGQPRSEKIPQTPTARELAYKDHDAHLIGYEVACVWGDVLGFSKDVTESEFSQFRNRLLEKPGERLRMVDTIHLARIIYRNEHLSPLGDEIEDFFHRFVRVVDGEPDGESYDDQVCFAKAIFPVSKPDAEAHFGRAIEATSKFGYELNERWRAILAVATRAASNNPVTHDLCQRFFRSAEVVAEGVAREKYWDRCETFAIGLEMNTTVALAAWSRWRDRRLISYRPTLLRMAMRAIQKEILPPSTVWPLTGFLECNASAELHAESIAAETEPALRETMKSVAMHDLRLAGASRSDFETLAQVVGDLPELSEISPNLGKKASDILIRDSENRDASEQEFDGHVSLLLENCDIQTTEGLRRAIKGLGEIPPIRYPERFWSLVIKKVPRSERKRFLDNLSSINEFDFYDLTNILSKIRQWKKSASIQDYWSSFLEGMGARFSESVFSLGSMEYHLDSGNILADEFEYLQRGVFATIAETNRIHMGTVFLGFVTQCVTRLTEEEARELLDFALDRMELHISDDFGEGCLKITDDTLSPISGLLWSCLGSPYATERWQAMHAVRRLIQTKNQSEIDHLFGRMNKGEVGIYGCAQYDFYLLHARLYLLTGLNRAAMDNCELLEKHLDNLQGIARSEPAHLLIQRTAAEICLKIGQRDPSLLTTEELQELSLIGHSNYPLEKTNSRSDLKDAPWELPKTPGGEFRHYFYNDFGWYWFPQLQSLFGIGQQHIEYLAKQFIETSLKKTEESDTGWLRDKRSDSRSNHRSRSENFQHSHGSYPSADALDFYCEYHSFLHAATRLLETTPVIREEIYSDYERDPLNSWLRRHKLTLDDGTWLCDRRDPAPRTRRRWTSETSGKDWKTNVAEDDFYGILHESNWVVLQGSWTDCNNGSIETLRVKSALVEPESSGALGRFLSCQKSPYDVFLPLFPDDESTIDELPFLLQGIVQRSPENSLGLSKFDPYSGDLPYPPLELDARYVKILNIKPDSQSREWHKCDSNTLVMKSEIWNQQGDETGRTYPSGQRIRAEQLLLSELCEKTGMDIIFCVEIHRYYERESSGYYNEDDDKHGRGLHFKIFIYSADGKFRELQGDD